MSQADERIARIAAAISEAKSLGRSAIGYGDQPSEAGRLLIRSAEIDGRVLDSCVRQRTGWRRLLLRDTEVSYLLRLLAERYEVR